MCLEFDQIFNLLEGILWIAIALVFAFARRSRKEPIYRPLLIRCSITFLLFGISDLIEIKTRAWYSPWSLLALKAACVASLVYHFFAYLRMRRSAMKR